MKFSYPVTKILPLLALCIILFVGCAKTDSLIEPIKPPIETPPIALDGVKVAATVSGSVIDENNQPVINAIVTSGTASTTTDAMGNFSFRNIVLSALNGNVTVNKAGYFKGIRNFTTEAGKNNYVKIQLIKQVLTGTVPAAGGGSVTTNGAMITFPASAFETAAGAPYTGNVNVYAAWIDPTAANLPLVVPGDLRGLNSSNGEYLLRSYGMVGAELKDDNGNALKIATGKTVSVSFPIPASLQSTAPATIPLWHFDEVTNRWREEGTATKNGNNYVGQVNKFSFWNVDIPANFVNLEMRLLNSTNNLPLANTMVKITSLATNTSAYDYTNDSGYVSGYVPKNENLRLDVIAGTACNTNTVVYTQNIGPYTTNTSLGEISVTIPPGLVINFTGIVKNCSNQPVSNGYVSLSLANGTSTIAYTNASGAVNFSLVHCGGNTAYSYIAVDLSNGNYSNIATGTTTSNAVNLGNISACGNTINLSGVYIAGSMDGRAVLWKDGIPTFLTPLPIGNKTAYAYDVKVYNNDLYVLIGEEDSTVANGYIGTIKLWKNGVITNVTSGLTEAYPQAFDIYNGDIYIMGYEGVGFGGASDIKVWKNGVVLSVLPKGNFYNIEIVGSNVIKVINGDVYVAGGFGILDPNGQNSMAFYWKNGVINFLPTVSQFSGAESMFFNGTDIYFCGVDSSKAVYWKNGIETFLNTPPTQTSAHGNSIFVENNNIYLGGRVSFYDLQGGISYSNATYWKNGSITMLTNNTTTGIYYEIWNIFVKNNIVYSIGSRDGSLNSILYFQNNVPLVLQGINNAQEAGVAGIYVE